MSSNDNNENDDHQQAAEPKRSLQQAINVVKTRQADVDDVVVDLKEAESARLELLAAALQPVIDSIDDADQRFDVGITQGSQPRLWIDMTAFVAMGHDKRSYRFHKDTRMGRIVLAETNNMSRIADIVSNYMAEKIVERERMIEGEWQSMKDVERAAAAAVAAEPVAEAEPHPIVPEKQVELPAELAAQPTPESTAESTAQPAAQPVAEPPAATVDSRRGSSSSSSGNGIRSFIWFLLGFICSLALLAGAAVIMLPEAF